MPGPEIAAVVDLLRTNPPIRGDSALEMRASMDEAMGLLPPPEGFRFESVDAGGVRGEWAEPESGADPSRVLLYVHGGAYVMGGIETHRGLVANLSAASGVRVLSLDYALAPEHPFPAAVEDACAAYRWLLRQGVTPAQVAIGGDSAGGGLTVATLLALRDAEDPMPAAGVCISPWLDLTMSGETMKTRAEVDPMVGGEMLRECAQAYLGDTDPRTPLASPLFADPTGLPPLLVQVGSAEVLLDDSRRFGEHARAHGVDVSLEEWEDMIHVWHAFAMMLPEGQRAVERIADFLRERLA